LWQISDFTSKFLEAVNRKWLSKSRWSMLTAGTTQEISELLNGSKKSALLLSPWQSQYSCSSFSWSSFATLISPSYKVLQSANTFLLSNLLFLNFWNQHGRVGRFCLEGKRQEGLTYCAKDESEVPSSTHCLPAASCLRSQSSVSGYCPRCCSPKCI